MRSSAKVLRRWVGVSAVMLTLLFSQRASAKLVECVVAVVDDEILLLSELNERIRPLTGQLQQIPDGEQRAQRYAQLRREVLNHMIDEQLIKQEARRLKIEVDDNDLELAVKDVMRKNNLTREQLEEALRQEGTSILQYREQILRPQLLRLRVLNVQVRSRVAVSEDEVQALYQKNLRKLGVETKVQARHIFIGVAADATAAQVAERKGRAEALLGQLRQGADFAELAKQHSEDVATRGAGGDLGWFGRGTLPSNVENAVFTMKKGETSALLRTERGFHIVQVVDRKESEARPLNEVRDELREQLYAEKLEKATRGWLDEVRKRAHVDIKLAHIDAGG